MIEQDKRDTVGGPTLGAWAKLMSAVRRAVLGRSSWVYLKQYTGSDAYWDKAIAAELGWPDPARPPAAKNAAKD